MVWLIVVAVGIVGYVLLRASAVEPRDLDVAEKEVHIPGLPEGLDGLRIVHVSDLHLREVGDYERRVITAVKEADPDFLCLTGDFVSGPQSMPFLVPFLMEIARGRRTFAVLGNHDHADEVDTDFLVETLRRCGAALLVNEVHRVVVNGVRVYVAGVDDPHTDRADVAGTLALASPSPDASEGEGARFVLLLAHSPDALLDDAVQGADLVLSGHTHGGQICVPFFGPIRTNTKIGREAYTGVVERGGVVAHISRGVGTTTMRMRLQCRPEVTTLVLRRTPR